MSVYGCICEEKKKNSPHKSPGCHFLLKLKIRKMSGFQNSETTNVTFDPTSINACEKQVLLPAIYLKQHDISQEELPMQSLPQSNLCRCNEKLPLMDFMYSHKMVKDERKLNNSEMSNTPVFMTDENCLISLLILHQLHTVSFVH